MPLTIYVDGSCKEYDSKHGKYGIGIIIANDNPNNIQMRGIRKEYNTDESGFKINSYIVEALAVIQAIEEYVHDTIVPVEIFLDNRNLAYKVLRNREHPIINKLFELTEQYPNIQFKFVKGHVLFYDADIHQKYNMLADIMARYCTTEEESIEWIKKGLFIVENDKGKYLTSEDLNRMYEWKHHFIR
jgi:ribonuclease HI